MGRPRQPFCPKCLRDGKHVLKGLGRPYCESHHKEVQRNAQKTFWHEQKQAEKQGSEYQPPVRGPQVKPEDAQAIVTSILDAIVDPIMSYLERQNQQTIQAITDVLKPLIEDSVYTKIGRSDPGRVDNGEPKRVRNWDRKEIPWLGPFLPEAEFERRLAAGESIWPDGSPKPLPDPSDVFVLTREGEDEEEVFEIEDDWRARPGRLGPPV